MERFAAQPFFTQERVGLAGWPCYEFYLHPGPAIWSVGYGDPSTSAGSKNAPGLSPLAECSPDSDASTVDPGQPPACPPMEAGAAAHGAGEAAGSEEGWKLRSWWHRLARRRVPGGAADGGMAQAV